MAFLRSARGATGVHPLLATPEALRAALDHAPVTVFLTDEQGDIVYRNHAAGRTLATALASLGEDGMVRLRQELKRVIASATSFPVHEDVHVRTGDRTLHAAASVDRVPGGYAVSWYDATAERDVSQRTSALARDVEQAGAQLASLGSALAESAAAATAQAGSLGAGADELSDSIQQISSGAAAAAGSTGTAVRSAVGSTAGAVDSLHSAAQQLAGSASQLRGLVEHR